VEKLLLLKNINQDFFKTWTSEMGYVLGYVAADGCITVSKDRKKNPFTFNITSAEKRHLYRIRKVLNSEHKISKKSGGRKNIAFQIQIRNAIIAEDLMKLGIFPRKTSNLKPITIPEKYFPDFVRGFFDGDGTVYIYRVNGTPQIKAGFVSSSHSFIREFNRQLCKKLNIPAKSIHRKVNKKAERMIQYDICFYINDCDKLAEFLYGNDPILYLYRKRKIFEKWKLIKRRGYIKQNYPSKVGWYLNQKVFA